MKVKLIGLGKMGLSVAKNLLSHDYRVEGFDVNPTICKEAEICGVKIHRDLNSLLEEKSEQQLIWVMLPAGEITRKTLADCSTNLKENDIIIDAGNSKYSESVEHFYEFAKKGIHFLDVGTSGGVSGAENGACMMIGGEQAVFSSIEKFFKDICVENGYLYCGKAGSGHYLKMVHNGIEYGMMQAIGEGFNVLHHSMYDYDLAKVAQVFNHGSVIRSWLMELTQKAIETNPTLDGISGEVPSSGEGKWTVEEVLDMELYAPVITQSLFARYNSTDKEKFGEKIVASLRNQFGGHDVPTIGKGC